MAPKAAIRPTRMGVANCVEDVSTLAAGAPALATDWTRPGMTCKHVRFTLLNSDRMVCTWAGVAIGVVSRRVRGVCAARVEEKPVMGRLDAAPSKGVSLGVTDAGLDGAVRRSPNVSR